MVKIVSYSDLTEYQKSQICNGCGSKSGWIKVPNFLFKASCNQHDFYYWRGCTEEDRKIADKAFYKYMRIDIKEQNLKIGLQAYYHFWALSYYTAVRYFGKKHFYFSDKMKDLTSIEYLKVPSINT